MNALDYLLRLPWVEPLGRTLIHFLWQGALIGVAAWALLRLARRRAPALRHALAAGALALCALCPLSTFLCLAHPWHRAWTRPEVVSRASPAALTHPAFTAPGVVAVNPTPGARPAVSPSLSSVLRLRHGLSRTTVLPALSTWQPKAVRWAVLLWIAGVTVLGGRLSVGWIRVQFWRGGARQINDARLTGRFLALADRLGLRAATVRLLVSHAADLPGPLAMGLWRPVVLLPARVLERLPLAQIEALLAHELAHVRRHDYLWNLLVSALEVSLFYHPAVWFLGRELRAAREECCDALAAGVCPDRIVYAQALAAVAEWRAAGPAVPAPAAARGPLLRRMRWLLGLDQPPEPLFTGRNAGWALALAGVVLATTSILYSDKLMAQNEDDPNIPTVILPAPRGLVVDRDGQPVPGARVLLYHAVSYWALENRVDEEVISGADGGFAFSRPLRFKNPAARRDPPNYTIFAVAPGRAPAWAALRPETPPDRVFTLTLTPPKPQTYEVVDREGKPVAGTTVWLRYAGKQMNRQPFFAENFNLMNDIGICRALTDASGRATLAELPDTEVSIAASKPGFEDDMSGTTPREGVPRFTLRPAAVLEGRVTDPLGRPVEGGTVALYPKFRYNQYFLARTDADGRYRVEKIWSDRAAHPDAPDWGKYTVMVRHPLFTSATREVAFSLGQTITGFDLTAVPGTEIIGRLLDPVTRAPVVGAAVFVDSPSGRQGRDTDGTGGFRCRVMPGKIFAAFSGPPRGSYVVENERSSSSPTTVSTQADGERFPIELFLPGPLGRLGTVRGRIETPDGRPAALCAVAPVIDAARFQLSGWSGNTLRGVETDEHGVFELPGMPIGLGFTLSGQTPDGRFRGTLAGRLENDALDLPAPLVLRGTQLAEVLLTDLLGQPRPNLEVNLSPVVAGKNLWLQQRKLRSGPDGVLRLPDAAPGGTYEVSLPGRRLGTSVAEAQFTVPAATPATPGPRPTLVMSEQCLVRLLGTDGEPVGIKAFQDYEVELHREDRVTNWSNGPLVVAGRTGPDVILARETLVLGKGGDVVHFLIETEAGKLLRADGVIPTDGSLRIVARATENLPGDTAPDPGLTQVGEDEIAGRAVDADGKPIPGVLAAFPTRRWAPADTVQALSGDDGVFRLPMRSQNRYAYLTLSKTGWGPVFLTDVPSGQGFRVTLQNTTRLRGTIGGEHPGRVELLLEKNKFTRRADSLDHEVRDIQFRTATDDQGVYDFPMEAGQYRWTATSADGRFARGEISLGAGETRDLGASLRCGYDVVLELHDVQTGQPVPGIGVCIMDREGFATIVNRAGSERTSDADGRLRWENLPPGETQFEAWGMRPSPVPGRKQSAYARWWLDDPRPATPATRRPSSRDGLGSLRVTVGDGMTAPVRIRVERGVKISGTVVDADGKGLANVEIGPVTEHGGMTGDMRFNTRTGPDGSFLACLPAGNGLAYQLCAYFAPWTEKVPAANTVSEPFGSQPGDERTFRLVMGKGGFFTGRIIAADGNPGAGFKVTAVAGDDRDSAYAARIATAGADGRFRLGPLRPGKYKVYPGTGGGAPLRKLEGAADHEGEIAADGDARDLGDIALPTGAKLRE